MIDITVDRRGLDGRGLLWESAATYGGRTFTVTGHQPIRDVLRELITTLTPGFTDSPWQLVRDGRVDLFGPSARTMAAMRVDEGDQGTRHRRDDPATAAIYAASEIFKPVMTGSEGEA